MWHRSEENLPKNVIQGEVEDMDIVEYSWL